MDLDKTIQNLRSDSGLSIIRLAEPIFATRIPDDKHGNRVSNASSTASDTTRDPASLKADLQHYRELFSKLRFSYVEQVTKEKFLRTIAEDAPFVTAEENKTLDVKNKEHKADLSDKKEDLNEMLIALEAQGRELAHRWHGIELQTTQLEMLPVELEELEAKITELQASKEPQSEDPDMRLPLQDTLALLAEREREAAAMDAEILALQSALTRREAEVKTLEDDFQPLQQRREKAVEYMRAAQAQEQNTAATSAAEIHGRWLANCEAALKLMLEV